MSFRLIHASGNQFDTDRNRRAMYPAAAAKGDVFTTGEANKDHATLRAIPGFDSVIYSELSVAWRRSDFDLIQTGARLVMGGGKHGPLGSKSTARRGPNRYALVAVLREKKTGQQWIIATHHSIAKADTSFLWRRPLRSQGFKNFAAFVAAYRKRYPHAQAVLTGDWNAKGAATFPGFTELPTPATFGRLRYDRIQVSSDVRSSGLAKFATVLDHDGLAVTLSAMGATPTPPPPAPKPPEAPVAATSQNGYTANTASLMQQFTVPGTDRKVTLRKGAPGQLLVTFAAWFDKNIESVDGGILDDWGYANRPIRGSTTGLSNHASGTALDINAPRHPLGKAGTFTPAQAAKIRAELKRYDGAIRWGGDYSGRKDEMHFEIHADVATCERVLAKVTAPQVTQAPVLNHVQIGRQKIKTGRALIAEGIKEMRQARTAKGEPRPAVQAQADAYEAADAAMGAAYTKGPSK